MTTEVFQYDFATSATSSYDADGFLTVGVDNYGDAGSSPAELHHPFGFLSRPLDPQVDANGNPTLGCTLKVWDEGSRKHAMALADCTVTPNLAQCGKGDSMQYCASNAFIKCTGAGVNKGRIAIGTSDTNGSDMGILVSPVPTDGIQQFGAFGLCAFNTTGWHLKTQAGSRIDVGGIYGIQGPAASYGRYIRFTTAKCEILASTIDLGNKGAASRQPVALAQTLQLALTAIGSALAGIQEAVTALGAQPCVNGAALAIGPVSTAIGNAAAAVSAAQSAIAPAGGMPQFASATTLSA